MWGDEIDGKKMRGRQDNDDNKHVLPDNHFSGSCFCQLCGCWRGSLGLEPQFEDYIRHLIQIFDEVKRVLRKDGTCFVNLGDSYSGSGKGIGTDRTTCKEAYTDDNIQKTNWNDTGVKAKSLCQIPSRFAIAMTDAGWILRNHICWYKKNAMPSSAKDRFTVDWESVFFFVKNKKYWFEQQFEPVHDLERLQHRFLDPNNNNRKWRRDGETSGHGINPKTAEISRIKILEDGRNKRCVWKPTREDYLKWCEQWYDGNFGDVWDVTTQGRPEAHFATFPDKLVEPMIKAGCPERGIVLDIFCGSGTACAEAKRLNRQYIGFDLNAEYVTEIAEKKLAKTFYQHEMELK